MRLGASHRIRGYEVDTEAIYRGALLVTVLSVPLAAVAGRLIDDDSGWQVVIMFAIFAVFFAGGAVSGSMRPETPALHGALSAVPPVAVLTLVRMTLAALGDAEFDLVIVAAMFAFGTTLGLLGGVAASRFSDRPRSLIR